MGLWSIPHRCPLIGSSLLFFRYIHWHMCGQSTHWRFLHIINWHCLWEISDKQYRCFKDKELYGSNTINGHQQPRDQKPAQHIGVASANPRRNGWMAHWAKPWVGTIVAEWSRAERSEWQTRKGWSDNDRPPTNDHQERDDQEKSNAISKWD